MIGGVGKGTCDVSYASDMARAMVRDGCAPQVVEQLAAIGGKWDQNRERSLHTWLKGLYGLHIEPYYLKLQLDKECGSGTHEVEVPVLIPFEVANAIWRMSQTQFGASFLDCSDPDCLQHYWAYIL